MISWTRLAAWMVVLGVPASLLQPTYCHALAAAATYVLRHLGQGLRIREVTVQQPLNIAIFIALCLATRNVARGRLVRAIVIGTPIVALLGLGVVVGVSAAFDFLRRYGATVSDPAPRALAALIDGLPWIASPLLWLAFLWSSESGSRPTRGQPR